ncbi:hypothetical protein [Consotaella salsifontis]|uniref:Uncharacterized protein n=1 Tax=Consotaella salsifontis TaxID=1365950 RepID=A0A1T4RL83_9HYPH|nr:hypothetical protein [Consotaella salsifontis]SKA16722.1 hypothetical protein SAMN05428963_10743 [Consotaella salsifontis]
MVMTSAERQRKRRERIAREQKAMPDEAAPYIRRPFSEFFWLHDGEHIEGWQSAEEMCAYAGIELPWFRTEDWPEFDTYDLSSADIENRGSISKAELLVGALHEALDVLTQKINAFKREEIEARIKELEESDLSDPSEKKRALREIVRLNKIKDQLGKRVRLEHPVTEVKG